MYSPPPLFRTTTIPDLEGSTTISWIRRPTEVSVFNLGAGLAPKVGTFSRRRSQQAISPLAFPAKTHRPSVLVQTAVAGEVFRNLVESIVHFGINVLALGFDRTSHIRTQPTGPPEDTNCLVRSTNATQEWPCPNPSVRSAVYSAVGLSCQWLKSY